MRAILFASTALVFAGSSQALDVALNGHITISADIEVNDSGFNGANWDSGITLKASGESMGWTYGGTLEMGMADPVDSSANADMDGDGEGDVGFGDMDLFVSNATLYMGGDFMGRVSFQDSCGNFVNAVDTGAEMDAADEVGAISGHCINWTGMNLGGLELKAALGLDSQDLVFGLEYLNPNLGKFDLEYDVVSENWDAEIATIVGGTTIAIAADYNSREDNNDGDFDYVVTAQGSFGDFKYGAAYSPNFVLTADTIDRDGSADDTNVGYDGYFSDVTLQQFGPGPFTFPGSGDGTKALGLSLGYDCFGIDLGLDLERHVDATYEALQNSATPIALLNVLSTALSQGILPPGVLSAADPGRLVTPTGSAQTIDLNSREQGLLGQWEANLACEIHEGVEVTASLGAESERAVALEQAAYVQSQLEAALGQENPALSPFTTVRNLGLNSGVHGSIGMKVTF